MLFRSQGFRSTKGFPFASILKFSADLKLEFDFGQDKADENGGAPVDFTGKPSLGACPKCKAGVFEHGMNYVCEHSVGPTKMCDFRTGKIILQQPIEAAQVTKLLAEGKTDLLTKFVSNRTQRAFKAFLVLDKTGKVSFEFEKRDPKKGGARKPKEPAAKVDFTGQESLGKCPRCEANVFEGPTDYLCEKMQAEKKPC